MPHDVQGVQKFMGIFFGAKSPFWRPCEWLITLIWPFVHVEIASISGETIPDPADIDAVSECMK